MSGYSREEVVGHEKIWEWLYPDQEYRKQITETVNDILQSGRTDVDVETKIRRKDGQTRIISWNERALTDQDGKAIGTIAIGHDITERRRMEERVRSLHKHALQLRSATSIEEIVKYTLDAAEFALGFDWADVLTVENGYLKLHGVRGAHVAFSVLPLNGPGISVRAANTKSTVRVSDTRKDAGYVDGKGTDWKGPPTMLSEIAVPVITDNEVVAVLNVESTQLNAFTYDDQALLETLAAHVASDMKRLEHERELENYSKHLEALVEERTKKLRQVESLAAIGETAAMVGHDLRNPLQGITGAAYNIRKHLQNAPDPSTKEMLAVIDNGIEYANGIINDLLEFSREMQLQPVPTTPKSMVKQTLTDVKIPNNITIEDTTADAPEILADEPKIKRVLTNLIENAIDAMPEGGRLSISSMNTQQEVSISVRDTGFGIPQDMMEKIWTPLYTTKAKGIGLGLPICRRIVEAHGGSISVESTVGKGTTFTLILPIQHVQAGGEPL
jgi:PAS domain S-box-containing protein